MDYLKSFITPTLIFCIIVVVGYFIGKIKILSVSLDISAVLIVAILSGCILSRYFNSMFNPQVEIALSNYSKLGSSLFSAVIGINAGYGINRKSVKRSILYFSLGAVTVFAGIVSAKLIASLDGDINKSVLAGILCGALTSTPGLSSVCEMENINSELATIGYGVAYLFGVIGVVLFVQMASRKSPVDSCCDKNRQGSKCNGIEGLAVVCLVSVLGQIVGLLNIPVLRFSLGTTGGTVICGIISGMIINKFGEIKRKIEASLPVYRSFGLVLFLVGNGVSAGRQISANLEFRWFAYGAIITTVSLAVCEVIGHLIFNKRVLERMAMISGAMTSTPAIGVVMKKTTSSSSLAIYSLTYLGALMSMLFWVRILCL